MRALRRHFHPEDLEPELRAAGIAQSVAVQARQNLEETRWLLALADQHAFVAGVVGWVDLQGEDVADQLAAVRHPKLVGIRHFVQSEPDDFLRRPGFRRGIAALEHAGLAYDLLVYPRQLTAAIELVAAFGGVRFVLDHLGKPDVRSGEIRDWARHIRTLASFPNVCAKLSGLVTEADWQLWCPEQLTPYLDAAFEAFGADRLMLGSDWPVCTLAADYGRTVGVVTAYLDGRPALDREAVLGGTARRFWRLQ
jgi:L-fuconolactonase